MADSNNRYSRRSGLSADYADPEPESAQSGVTNRTLPRSGSRKAAIAVGVLAAVVVGLLVSRMPFLSGSLNAGAPVDEVVTGSVEAVDPASDASSSMPTPDQLTPSTPPEGEVLIGTEAAR